jgi:DNA polymerase iota
MDELFCDVTEMVHAHLDDLRSAPSTEDSIYFNLAVPKSDEPKGFHYLRSVAPSLVIPGTSASQEAQYAPELLAGAHLASYIRAQILEKQHFTTSAGIAHNKLIAKLVGNLNKPNLQTTWNPDVRTWKEEQKQFLAPFEARK